MFTRRYGGRKACVVGGKERGGVGVKQMYRLVREMGMADSGYFYIKTKQ